MIGPLNATLIRRLALGGIGRASGRQLTVELAPIMTRSTGLQILELRGHGSEQKITSTGIRVQGFGLGPGHAAWTLTQLRLTSHIMAQLSFTKVFSSFQSSSVRFASAEYMAEEGVSISSCGL